MQKKSMKPNCPTESVEQQTLFRWAEIKGKTTPELKLLFHVPNEGKRNPRTGARLKAEGMKSGVPDLWLPVPRNGYHGLIIELKRQHGGQLTPDQREWLNALEANGYKALMCRGWFNAAEQIMKYLRGE